MHLYIKKRHLYYWTAICISDGWDFRGSTQNYSGKWVFRHTSWTRIFLFSFYYFCQIFLPYCIWRILQICTKISLKKTMLFNILSIFSVFCYIFQSWVSLNASITFCRWFWVLSKLLFRVDSITNLHGILHTN